MSVMLVQDKNRRVCKASHCNESYILHWVIKRGQSRKKESFYDGISQNQTIRSKL